MEDLQAKMISLILDLLLTALAFSVFPFFYVRSVESIDQPSFKKKMVWNAVIVEGIFFLLNPSGANFMAAFIWYAVTNNMGLSYLKKHGKLLSEKLDTSMIPAPPLLPSPTPTPTPNPEVKREMSNISTPPTNSLPTPISQHRFCMNCGAPLTEADRFCRTCGTKISR